MCNLLRAGKVEGTKIALHCGLLLCYLVIAILFSISFVMTHMKDCIYVKQIQEVLIID